MTTPSLPQAVLTAARELAEKHAGWATWDSDNAPTPNGNEPHEERAYWLEIVTDVLSRMGGESVPAETWIVVKEHVWEHGDGGRPTLAYLLPSEFGRQTFPSFDAASAWIKDGQWPLGFAAMKLDAPTAPAQQAAPSMWTGSRAGVESYGALEHEDRFDAEQAADVQGEACSACGDDTCHETCMGRFHDEPAAAQSVPKGGPTEQQMLDAAIESGLLPNTIGRWTPALRRYTKAILAASAPTVGGKTATDLACAKSVWWDHNRAKFTTSRQAAMAAWDDAVAWAAPSAPAVGEAPAVMPAGDAVKQAEQLVKDFKEAANSRPNASNGYNLKIWDDLRDKLAAALAATAPAQPAAQEPSAAAEPVAEVDEIHQMGKMTTYLRMLPAGYDLAAGTKLYATPPTPPSAPAGAGEGEQYADLHFKFGCFIDHATGGKLSKPEWALETLKAAHDEYLNKHVADMVDDALESAPPSHEGEDARDAARYRWLRDHTVDLLAASLEGAVPTKAFHFRGSGDIGDQDDAQALDAKIDAARAGGSQ